MLYYRDEVSAYVDANLSALPALALRDFRNKLATGLKTPRK